MSPSEARRLECGTVLVCVWDANSVLIEGNFYTVKSVNTQGQVLIREHGGSFSWIRFRVADLPDAFEEDNAALLVSERLHEFTKGKHMRTIAVAFNSQSGNYHYLSIDDSITTDDHVVVESPHSGYTVAKVVDVTEGAAPKATKFIVCKVDDSAYRKRIMDAKERAEIIKKLHAKEQKLQEQQRYAHLASSDPEAKALLERLGAIDGEAA